MTARVVLQHSDISRALTRISHEILESNRGADGLVLLGIPTRGVYLADRIGRILDGIEPGAAVGVTRCDDVPRRPRPQPDPRPSAHPSRRRAESTARRSCSWTTCSSPDAPSAPPWMRSPTSAGRARSASPCSSTADTGELPIRADYVGKNLPTSVAERINVHLNEIDDNDEVTIGA